MNTSKLYIRYACASLILALLTTQGMLVAQDANWTSCGTYPATLYVFTVNIVEGEPVISADRGLYTYDWSTHRMTKYNQDEISATTYWNLPILTIADRAALNGRLFAYTPGQQGQLVYSDDAGKNWHGTTSPTGAADYSGIAVLDSGVILATTKEGANFGKGVAISYDNGDTWSRLTEPHNDTGSIAPSVSSCYGSGKIGFYNTELRGANPAKFIATFDGGETWVRLAYNLSMHYKLIGGDDSTVVAYKSDVVARINFKTGTGRAYSVPYDPGTTITSAYVDGDQILVSITRTDSNQIIKDHSILMLNSDLEVVDSIPVQERVRSVRRVNGELWVFFQSRIGKVQGSTVTTSPIVYDVTLQSYVLSAVRTPDGGVFALSQTEISRSDNCGVAEPLRILSPHTISVTSISIDDQGVIFCTGNSANRVDFASGAVVDLHRNLPKGFLGSYSRFSSIIRSHSGRLIGSPAVTLKRDSIGPAMFISDDEGSTWRAVTTGFHPRLLVPDVMGGGRVYGSKVVETQSGVVLTGLRNGGFDSEEPDSALVGSGIYYSNDDGETWVPSIIGTPLYGAFISDLAVAANKVYALASALVVGSLILPSTDVHLYVSNDDGKQWHIVFDEEKLGLTMDSRLTSYQDTLFLFGIGPTGLVRYSVDSGATFKRYWEPESGSLRWFTVSKHGAAATTSEGVFIKGVLTSVAEEGKDGEQIQRDARPWIVVSPLPADDQLSVSFSHLGEFIDGLTSVKMYSTTGDIVTDLTSRVRDAVGVGNVTITIDCKTLADGVYLVHMAAGRDSLTRKVMIRK